MGEITLNKQIWIDQIMENFYPETSFLNYARDFSGLVDNEYINMAEAGIDPKVLINNTTYPIKKSTRADKLVSIKLDLFETENTIVRTPEAIQLAYDKLESVLMGHRNSLRTKTAEKAAHAYAPYENTDDTPVIETTGDTVNGRKRIKVEDILLLKERFDDLNYPQEGRYLVLNPKHVSDLILFDVKSFKNILDIVNGRPQRFAGFNILQTTITPTYNSTTKQKVDFGAAAEPSTDTFCSFAFIDQEVMKADGDIKMYVSYDDPEERGTIVGFDKRFIATPIRNKGIGAILSAKSV